MMKTWSSSRSMSRTAQSARSASRCESRARRPIRRGKGTLLPFPASPIRPTAPHRWCSTGRSPPTSPPDPCCAGCTAGIAWARGSPPRASRSVKPRASQAGLKAAEAYAGHGLRRGFLTSAARNRVTSRSTCCASTWKMPSASRIMPSKGCCAGEGDSRSGRPRSAPILGQKCVR